MAELKKFKTESKRLLELMINSIYTHKDIFLREIISNASDAIDRHHFSSLTDESLDREGNYSIIIERDEKNRTITIKDNGIGMTHDELINSLGTIAKSGSKEFLEKMDKAKKEEQLELIGQFGVGFYSAYMVASKVNVKTKSPFSDKAYMFSSDGVESYKIEEIDKTDRGTEVVIYLKEEKESHEYDHYLEEFTLRDLVKKYSDYVRYPIKMEVSKSVPKLDEKGEKISGEYDEVTEIEILNSMVPLWKKPKKEQKEEEINSFYRKKYYDYEDPFTHLLLNVEGNLNYTALVFIPKHAPQNMYSEKYEKGLQLYSRGVFIMDKCKDLVPDYLRFIKGLVDTSDLPLNISREVLQKTTDLDKIGKNVEKKILSRLEKLLKNDREKYIEFFKQFGVNIKYGVYDQFGASKDLLKDLLIYETTNKDAYVTLSEYVKDMPKEQEYIYYASSKNKVSASSLPQMDLIKKKGFDVLIFNDDIDEFAISMLGEYEKKKFKSINQGDLGLKDEIKDKKIEELTVDHKDLLDKLKTLLEKDVVDVRLSKRLTDAPVCLVSEDGVSFEMEKALSHLPNSEQFKASRVLEINPNHKMFKSLENLFNDNDSDLEDFADLLYQQALMIEGFPLKDPVSFSNKMTNLMIKAASK